MSEPPDAAKSGAASTDRPAEDASFPTRRNARLAQVGAEQFSFADAVGGARGMVEAVLPGLLFVLIYTIGRDLVVAAAVAVGVALLAAVLRLIGGSPVTQAFAGIIGVVICAGLALFRGDARDFYLPGFLLNIGYGLACLISALVPIPARRAPGTDEVAPKGPWPAIGLLVGPLSGEGFGWLLDPARRRLYRTVTLVWAAFFALRLVVQVPLYLADAVGALGAARLAMGVPAFALMLWISWLLLRARPSRPRARTDGAEVTSSGPAD